LFFGHQTQGCAASLASFPETPVSETGIPGFCSSTLFLSFFGRPNTFYFPLTDTGHLCSILLGIITQCEYKDKRKTPAKGSMQVQKNF
jgi:hypothetical protein